MHIYLLLYFIFVYFPYLIWLYNISNGFSSEYTYPSVNLWICACFIVYIFSNLIWMFFYWYVYLFLYFYLYVYILMWIWWMHYKWSRDPDLNGAALSSVKQETSHIYWHIIFTQTYPVSFYQYLIWFKTFTDISYSHIHTNLSYVLMKLYQKINVVFLICS